MRPRPARKNTAQQGNRTCRFPCLGQQDSHPVDEHCHAEYTESCKFPGFCLLSFQRSLFTWMLHLLLCTLVRSLADDQCLLMQVGGTQEQPNPDQYFQRANKKPCSKLAGFIRLEQHLPLHLQTAHS